MFGQELVFSSEDIQALRAFRRAEIIFEAVLFESCVGEAAGTMAVASI